MKKELFDQLCESVREAGTIRRGEAKPSRIFRVKSKNEVARVRGQLKLSQSQFAHLLGISVDTLQNWEQGRRQPTGAAKVLLRVASAHPEAVLEAAA